MLKIKSKLVALCVCLFFFFCHSHHLLNLIIYFLSGGGCRWFLVRLQNSQRQAMWQRGKSIRQTHREPSADLGQQSKHIAQITFMPS